jgi:hypothetical protein
MEQVRSFQTVSEGAFSELRLYGVLRSSPFQKAKRRARI